MLIVNPSGACYVCGEPAPQDRLRCDSCAPLTEIDIAGLVRSRFLCAAVEGNRHTYLRASVAMADAFRSNPAPDGHARCTRCGVAKPVSKFYKDAARPTGHTPSCKDCQRIDDRRKAQVDAMVAKVLDTGASLTPGQLAYTRERLQMVAAAQFPYGTQADQDKSIEMQTKMARTNTRVKERRQRTKAATTAPLAGSGNE